MTENTNEKKYTLTVTRAQAQVIRDACEAMARIGIGQYDKAIMDNVQHVVFASEYPVDAVIQGRAHLEAAVEVLGASAGFGPNYGPGIHSDKVPAKHRNAWDICQVLRYELAKEQPEALRRPVDTQPLRAGECDLPEFKALED